MHIYQIGPRLVRAGIDLTILATDVNGTLPAFEESEGVKIRRVRAYPTNTNYFIAPGIYHVITQGDWDLIHCQGYNSFIPPLAMFAALRANIPYVLSLHSAGDESLFRKSIRGLQRSILRPLLARAEKLIAVSEFEASCFRDLLHLPAEQFAIISNGVGHLPEVPEAAEGAINGAVTSPLILSIGRLVKYKGHQRMIAAMPKVLEQVPDAHLRIAGVGPYESALQKKAEKLGIADRVEIRSFPAGDWSGTASLITHAGVVTLLSDYESQGIAVLEALSLQRPVLVTGTSGLQEFVDRGLVRAIPLKSTPEEVAAAVVKQLRQPLIPVHVELPTWDDCAAKHVTLYQSVAQRVNLRKEMRRNEDVA